MKNSVLIVLFSLVWSVQGQTLITGKVLDSIGQPLPQANVILKSKQRIIKYTLTDATGYFEASVPDSPQYTIKITYFGYKSVVKKVLKKVQLTGLTFTLYPAHTNLKEVIIHAEIPEFIQKKDTIVYNLKALTDGSERNLKDLVQKLPGIQIDKNGKIMQNGKPIDKILINDKDFFNRQQQIATENIDAQMVSGISFYQNYKSEFDAKNKNGIRALNVNIKTSFMSAIKGNILGGLSVDKRYKVHLNLFKFTHHANLALISDVNNLGEKALTLNDYIDFTGGVETYLKGHIHSGMIEIDEENIPLFLLKKDDVKQRQTKFAGLNLVWQKPHHYRFLGFYLLNYMQQTEMNNQTRRFMTGQTLHNDNSLAGHYFIVNAFNKFSGRLSTNDLMSVLLTVTWQKDRGIYHNMANEKLLNNGFVREHKNFGADFNYNRTISDYWTADLNLSYNYRHRHDLFNLSANYPFLSYFNLTILADDYVYRHKKTDYAITGKANFMRKYFNTSFVIGDQFQNDYLEAELDNSHIQNQLILFQSDIFGGIKLKYNQMAWHFITSVYWHYVKVKHNHYATVYQYISPFISLTYLFRIGHSLDLTYSYTRNPISARHLNSHYIFDDFQSLSQSKLSTTLQSLPKHQIALSYQNYLKKYRFYYSLNLNYNLFTHDIQEKLIHFTPQLYFYQKFLMPATKSSLINLNLNKSLFKHFFVSIDSRLSSTEHQIFYQNNLQDFVYQTFETDWSLYSKYKKSWLNAAIGLETKDYWSKYKKLSVNRKYFSTTFYVKITGKINHNLIKWAFYSGYEHLSFLQDEYIFKINPTVYYSINKSLEISLIGNNILNINQPVYTKHSQTDHFELFEQTAYLPGYIALNLKYSF